MNNDVVQKEIAINHLYKSIYCLEPGNNEIDAKILSKVTKKPQVSQMFENGRKSKFARPRNFSAQDVRQDMGLLKVIR